MTITESPYPREVIFTPAIRDAFGVDRVSTNTFATGVHPGILKPSVAMARARDFLAGQGEPAQFRLGRMSADGNFVLSGKIGLIRHRLLIGPRSYALLSSFSGWRRLRACLEAAGSLAPFAPPVGSPLGNCIAPGSLLDLDWSDIPAMCRSEGIQTVMSLPEVYSRLCRDIFGVSEPGRIHVSLTHTEISWDIPSPDPQGLIRSFARPVSKFLLPRRNSVGCGRQFSSQVYAVAGRVPSGHKFDRFRLIAYEKLRVESGHKGLARFEARFDKKAILRVLGRQVPPLNRRGLEDSFSRLAAVAWPYLVAMDDDRTAAPVIISHRRFDHVVGGLRNRRQVWSVLDRLAADGRVPVEPRTRRLLQVLEREGWVQRMLFRTPAHRRLAPGMDTALADLRSAVYGSRSASPVPAKAEGSQ